MNTEIRLVRLFPERRYQRACGPVHRAAEQHAGETGDRHRGQGHRDAEKIRLARQRARTAERYRKDHELRSRKCYQELRTHIQHGQPDSDHR